MPKRNLASSANTSPKKSKTSTPSPAKLTRSSSKKPEEIEPPQEEFILEQLSSEEEGEAGSEDEIDATAKSKANPMKKQLDNLGYVVEEDLVDENSQQGGYTMNGQDKNELEAPGATQNDLKRKRSTSSSSPQKREPGINPTIAVNKLKAEFFENVNQYYEQILSEEPDEDDDEFVVDISTVKLFRALYTKGPEEEVSERKTILDQLFREYLLEEVVLKKKQWSLLLELSIKLAREEISSPPVPITLLTDLVELSSLQECEIVFQFIEARLSIWKESIFDSCKTSVLRLCNDLLRRLSREQDTILCGKILIFLSNYFPFSERSGLNVQSDFNTENITVYKQNSEKGEDDDPDDKMEIVEDKVEMLFEGVEIQIPGLDQMVKLCQQESKKGIQVDYGLYVKFWSLQEFFREPSKLYNKLTWRTFTMYTTDVLHAYKSFKLDESAVAAKRKKDETYSEMLPPETSDINPDDIQGKVVRTPVPSTSTSINVIPKFGDDTYFPKYLTNKRLLELQMGDPDFRKYFLIQLLIILQYLTSKVKFKLDSQVLSEEQTEYVKKTEEEAYQLLEQIPPEGPAFVHNLKHILKTEENWNKWKNEGCQAFKKPSFSGHAADMKDDMNADEIFSEERDEGEVPEEIGIKLISKRSERRQLGDIIREAQDKGKQLLGNPELTRLWNICPDNLEACRSSDRDFMPTIDTFFVEAMKELDAGDPVINTDTKKEVKPKKILGNPNFGWRALRLLARQSPLFFQIHAGSPITPMQSYLEFILKKIITEMEAPISTKQANEGDIKMNVEANERKSDEDEGIGDGDNEVAEDDDMITSTPKGSEGQSEHKIGEIEDVDGLNNNEKLRNLTEDEQVKLGKVLGADWRKLALKLSFKKDEIDFFETEKKEAAGAWMLKMWTEQEGEDASLAELYYVLEGLGLKEKADSIIRC